MFNSTFITLFNRTAPLLALSLVVTLTGCATAPAPRHESQAAPGVDLAGYGTFSLTAHGSDAAGDAPLRMLDVNVRDAIRAEMTRRGYREADGNPDLRIDYETATSDKVRSSPVRFGIGMGSWGGNVGGSVSMGTPSVESYQEGRLVIHVADAAKNQEVWNGTVSGQTDRQSLDPEAVARAVALAMESFPARSVTP